MLRVYVEQDVPMGRGQVRLRVVLHVLRTQPEILVLNFNVAVCEVEIPFLALLVRLETHFDRSRRQWRNNFLRVGRAKYKNTDGQGKEDAPPRWAAEFLNKSHDCVPPVVQAKPLPARALPKIAR
jgi:hypothetical protein